MSIELRILSGSRAGQTELHEKSIIAVGRHPLSDLRFDATHDLDVSTRHAEIRGVDGRYNVYDNHSTNGTFVNGERVPAGGARELRNGDVIGFGSHGPTASVRIADSRTTPIGERVTQAVETPPVGILAQASAPKRRPTVERIAMAVEEQTRKLKFIAVCAVIVLTGAGVVAYWIGQREAAASDQQLEAMMQTYDQTSRALERRLVSTNDTSLINALRRRNDSLAHAVHNARGKEAAVVQQALQRSQDETRAIAEMNLPEVHAANNPAVVLIHSKMPTITNEATGFSVSTSGLIVTNKHVVSDSTGSASQINVKFADTKEWHRAHLVRVHPDASIDLVLLQVDDAGKYPAVSGVETTLDVHEGETIATIGFPLGSDTPMVGDIAKTSLTAGRVSKIVPDVLQIDAYASHGSSGSPVFDGHGRVVGVVYGGAKEAEGRIVYAVPGSKIDGLLKGHS